MSLREPLFNDFKARKQLPRVVVEDLNNDANVTMRTACCDRLLRIAEPSLHQVLGRFPAPRLTHSFVRRSASPRLANGVAGNAHRVDSGQPGQSAWH